MATDLLTEIETFLAESGMGATYFGVLAAGNSELVGRLRRGKTVTLPTAEAIRKFIAECRAKSAGAAA